MIYDYPNTPAMFFIHEAYFIVEFTRVETHHNVQIAFSNNSRLVLYIKGEPSAVYNPP